MRIAVQDRAVVVLSNLKPRNMRGVKSNGMLLAASDAAHEHVELLSPPPGAMPGERIWFGSEADQANQAASATPNQVCQSILAFYHSLPFCSFFSNGAQQLGLN
jgi:tRNA-binding EMAP/Myf-like protein